MKELIDDQDQLEKEKAKKWSKVKGLLQQFCIFTVTGITIVEFEVAGQVLELPTETAAPAGVL